MGGLGVDIAGVSTCIALLYYPLCVACNIYFDNSSSPYIQLSCFDMLKIYWNAKQL